MIERLIRWLLFSVLFAAPPILINILVAYVSLGKSQTYVLFERGDLLLVTAGISAAAIGEVVGEAFVAGRHRRIAKIIAGGSCLLILVISVMMFAIITMFFYSAQPLDREFIKIFSLVVFFFALFPSGSIIALTAGTPTPGAATPPAQQAAAEGSDG